MSAVETILGCLSRVRMAPVLLFLATFATISQSSPDRYTTTEKDPIKQSVVNNLALQPSNLTTVGKSLPLRANSTGLEEFRAETHDLKDCKDDVIGCQNGSIPLKNPSVESAQLSKHNQSNDGVEKCNSAPCTNSSFANVHKLLFTPKTPQEHTNEFKVYGMDDTHENVFSKPVAIINRTNTDTFHVGNSNKNSAGSSSNILSHSENLYKSEKDENAPVDKNTLDMTNGRRTSELNTSSDLQNKTDKFEGANPTHKMENSLGNVENNNCTEKANPNETNPESCFHAGLNSEVRDKDKTGKESTKEFHPGTKSDGINPNINLLEGRTTEEATILLKSTLINAPPTTNSSVLSGNEEGQKNELPTDIAAKKQVSSGKTEKHRTKGRRNGAFLSELILSGLEMKPSAIKRSRLSLDNQSISWKESALNEPSSGGVILRKSSDKQENNTLDQVGDKGVRSKHPNVESTANSSSISTSPAFGMGGFGTNHRLTNTTSLQPAGDSTSEKAGKLSDDNLKQTEINFNSTSDNSRNLSEETELGVIYGNGVDTVTSSRPAQQNDTSDISGGNLDPFRSYGVVKYENGTKASGSLADLKTVLDGKFSTPIVFLTTESDSDVIESYADTFTSTDVSVIDDNETISSANASVKPMLPWPVKKEAVVEGDLVLGGLMMVHEREDTITCGPVMPQGGIQALEAMLYTLDRLNESPNPLLPNITLGAHILDDCDKDTYGLEMAVDFIKGALVNSSRRRFLNVIIPSIQKTNASERRLSKMKFSFIQAVFVLFFVVNNNISECRRMGDNHKKHRAYYYNRHKYMNFFRSPKHTGVYGFFGGDGGNFVDLDRYRESETHDLSETISHHHIRHHHDLSNHQDIPWPVKKEAVVEGDLVLGGLMMVHEREDTVTCGPVMPQGGIQALEAMLYTLDRLNEAPNPLLPNITLGAHILDDCDKDTYGLEMAVDFIKGSISNIDDAEYHCNKTQVRKVISGVVGAASSVTSIQVANLLRLFKIPQVSFFSTSPELSNKQRFEYFTRTIPSDHYQVKAMVDIVRLMGWSYISIIYEESNYGIKAFEELEDLLADYNICIAVKEKLVKDSGVADESAYDNIVQKLLTKPRARGAIIFGSDQEVAGVMRAVRRSNATGSFSWIGSDGWSARSLVSDGNEAEVEGTLSVQPQANPVRGFKEYFLSLNVENNLRNPWFVEFWEHHFQCRYPNSSRTPYNQRYTKMCTGKEKLSAQNTVFEDQLQFVSDAVMAFGYAIRNMHKDLCHGRPGLCDAMKPTKGTELLKYLRTVNFTGLSGDRFHFDQNGDGPARYNIIHFKQVSPGKYQWIRVGEYVEGELRLNMSEIQFKLGHPKPPESVCSLPCDLGQAKKYVEGESCCWHCFNCTQYQIRHPSDPTQCVACPQGTVPDPLHVRCNDIPEVYLRPDSGWAIGAMALSSTGILITMFVCGVFIRHNDTPVVRASGRELSYVLLAGILMCYCVTYALVLRPNDIVCGIQRFSAGFCFTVVYAALLTKTNRISRIFNAGKHSAKRPSFISPRSQLIICSGLIGVQVLINGVWMVISPAKAMHHYPTREDNLLVCSSYIDASYMIAFTYPIFLIIICTVYAVLTRKIPEAFNESKHIGFTMYTTCVIWLAFVPLYFGTANHVALRITSMSVTISLSASVTVVCLFSPKLYIILIRPERNIRQSMMPMRYSAINKSSATTGSGSMMAAVMVTAATCNQKQQIQKHVPPIEAEEETDVSDKIKPQTKDESTQTTPLSASTNSIHNNSQEHLQKINNNCNVGNGPLALLPGVQIKDIPL